MTNLWMHACDPCIFHNTLSEQGNTPHTPHIGAGPVLDEICVGNVDIIKNIHQWQCIQVRQRSLHQDLHILNKKVQGHHNTKTIVRSDCREHHLQAWEKTTRGVRRIFHQSQSPIFKHPVKCHYIHGKGHTCTISPRQGKDTNEPKASGGFR